MNYPNKKVLKLQENTDKPKKSIQKARLGIAFEELINNANEYYKNINKALIYKKPVPIRVTKVDYPSRNKAKIIEAFYQIPSTTDYNGIYNGKYIDFEAKSINGNTFPLSHLYTHQITHLKKVKELGGISFLIILFNDYHEVYILDADQLYQIFIDSNIGGRKSITYETFKKLGFKVEFSPKEYLSYLNVVDLLIKKE